MCIRDRVYSAVFYKVIIWNVLDREAETGYRTGTEIHIFPWNFYSIDHYEKDAFPDLYQEEKEYRDESEDRQHSDRLGEPKGMQTI